MDIIMLSETARLVIAVMTITGSLMLIVMDQRLTSRLIAIITLVLSWYFAKPKASSHISVNTPEEGSKSDMTPALFLIIGGVLIYLAVTGRLARVLIALRG